MEAELIVNAILVGLKNENKPVVDSMEHPKTYLLQQIFTAFPSCYNKSIKLTAYKLVTVFQLTEVCWA